MAVITSPVTGKTITALTVNDVMGMLYEDLATLIDGAAIRTRYPEFERNYGEWGAMITEGRIPAAEGTNVDPNTNQLCPAAYFSVDTRYYDEWIEAVYPSEVRRIDLTKILRGEAEYTDFLAKVVLRNVEGYRKDVNTSIDRMFVQQIDAPGDEPMALITWNAGTGAILASKSFLAGAGGTRYKVLDEAATPDDIIAEVLATVLDMQVENSTYTEGPAIYGADREDLLIYFPNEFYARYAVAYLQKLENMVGIDKLPEIRTYNDLSGGLGNVFAESPYKARAIFILDKRVINHVQRYTAYDEADISCRKSARFDLHVEHMLKYSPLYKAYAIIVPEQPYVAPQQ